MDQRQVPPSGGRGTKSLSVVVVTAEVGGVVTGGAELDGPTDPGVVVAVVVVVVAGSMIGAVPRKMSKMG